MRSRCIRFSLIATIALLGAGCAWTKPVVSPRIAEPLGQNTNSHPIPQFKGFGEIPPTPSPQLKPGVQGSVHIQATVPNLPPNIAVLRVKSGQPNTIELQQISKSINIPAGLVGGSPTSYELQLEWKDENGLHWTAHAKDHRITFENESTINNTLTVSSWPKTQPFVDAALSFLHDHGVNTRTYGLGFVEPDWQSWWNAERNQNHCMTSQTLESIRTLVPAADLSSNPFPLLPEKTRADCVTPEFPAQLIVHFSATQDGQAIFTNDGSPIYASSLLMDIPSGRVLRGWITVPEDPDRSDYPSLTLEEARVHLASGGLGGTPHGDVTITSVSFEWYRIDDRRTPVTSYLYPAFIGHGTIQYENGKSSPYRIVVPLVKQ